MKPMAPEVFAQAIVSIEHNYGLRLDARSVWIYMDAIACGKGWKGTKPGCKRAGGGKTAEYGIRSEGATTAGRKISTVAEIDMGRKAIGSDMLARLDSSIAPEIRKETEEVKKLRVAFDKIFDDDPVGAWGSPESKALTAAENRTYGIRQTAISVMEELRSNLFKMPRAEAEALAAKVQILKSASKNEAETREHLTEFIQMTNGKAAETFKKIKVDSARPNADIEKGAINLGRSETPDARKEALFHEFGHILEMNSGLYKSTTKWLDQRVTGPAQSMNKLSKFSGYGDDEIARPDHFIDPYVGKVYPGGITEVLAMGLERMISPKSMLQFYQSDPEHFLLTVGAIKRD